MSKDRTSAVHPARVQTRGGREQGDRKSIVYPRAGAVGAAKAAIFERYLIAEPDTRLKKLIDTTSLERAG